MTKMNSHDDGDDEEKEVWPIAGYDDANEKAKRLSFSRNFSGSIIS